MLARNNHCLVIEISSHAEPKDHYKLTGYSCKLGMRCAHLFILDLLVHVRIHDVEPKRRKHGHENPLLEAHWEFRHGGCEFHRCEEFVGIHVVVRVALEAEDKPVVQHVFISVP